LCPLCPFFDDLCEFPAGCITCVKPDSGTRIITAGKLEDLRSVIRGAATALGDAGNWDDPDAVAAQLSHNKLTGTSLTLRYTVPARRP
jgi:hypothetical protein